MDSQQRSSVHRERFLSTLGLCKKAGKLVMGFDPVAEALRKKTIVRIVTTEDLSARSAKEIALIASRWNLEPRTVPVTMDEVCRITGKRSGILGIADEGLAELIDRAVDRVNEEE